MTTAKIKAIEGVREWNGPKGTVHYFKLSMDNGDLGEIGKKSADALKVGDELNYSIEPSQYGNKFKEVRENGFGGGFSGGAKKGSNASFALAYCKDISVALIPLHPEKTPTDWTVTTLAMADKFLAWLKANEA